MEEKCIENAWDTCLMPSRRSSYFDSDRTTMKGNSTVTYSSLLIKGCGQRRIKSLQGPRPAYSVGPQGTEKCGGVWM
jgi:hypothetical protein